MENRIDRSPHVQSVAEVLRERAEDLLRAGFADSLPVSAEDIPKLVHELQIHHVELEMQNDELRKAQQTSAQACDHYTQLYDFSPAGYVTLTPDGLIEEANLRFCTMMGVPRSVVLNQPFHTFAAPQDWDLFRRHCLDVVSSGTTQTCKLRLLPKDGHPMVMHVESVIVKETKGEAAHIETAMLDITDREAAEIAARASDCKAHEASARLLTAQDDERGRIARDLHDDYCQRLTAAILELGMLPKRYPSPWEFPARNLEPVKTLLSGLLSDLRDLSHDLHPARLASKSLDEALPSLLTDFREKHHIATTLQMTLGNVQIPAVVSVCLYRIVQESLANVIKHAKAQRVGVTVTCVADVLELLVEDDGQGFVLQMVDGSHHLGLTSIRERAEHLQGTLKITSRPGGGTTIAVQIRMSLV